MAKYIFGVRENNIALTEELGGKTTIYLSTMAYWSTKGTLQETYEQKDIEEIDRLFEPLEIYEFVESEYITDLPASEVISKLEGTGLFQHSESFLAFCIY